jgi:hypothetical protein
MADQSEVEELVSDIIYKWIPAEQRDSPDITLLVFKMIESKSAVLGSRYRTLGGGKGSDLNSKVAVAVKALMGRENDEVISVTDDVCTLIESYTRFQPKP